MWIELRYMPLMTSGKRMRLILSQIKRTTATQSDALGRAWKRVNTLRHAAIKKSKINNNGDYKADIGS